MYGANWCSVQSIFVLIWLLHQRISKAHNLQEQMQLAHSPINENKMSTLRNALALLDNEINIAHEHGDQLLTQLSDVIKRQKVVLEKTVSLMNGIYHTFNSSRIVAEEIDSVEEIILEIRDHVTMMEQEISAKIEREMVDLRENLVKAFHIYQSPLNCPSNSHRFGGECLAYFIGARDWDSWRSHCKEHGGELASLNFPELPLQQLLKVLPELQKDIQNITVGMYATLLLGGRQNLSQRKAWQWLSGEPIMISDSRWFKDQPDMSLEYGQHCLGLRLLKTGKGEFEIGFEDISCKFKSTAICEMPKKTK